jgi:hypothetical protein
MTWSDVDALATALGRMPGVVLERDGDGVTVFRGVIVVDRAAVARAAAVSAVDNAYAAIEADSVVARVFDALEELVMLVGSVPEGVVELTLDGRAVDDVKDGPRRAQRALRALFAGVDEAWCVAELFKATLEIGEYLVVGVRNFIAVFALAVGEPREQFVIVDGW